MDLNNKVPLTIEVGTLATVLAGLYSIHNDVDTIAIPPSLYIELAYTLTPYLYKWDYEKIGFEDWVKYNLIIAPEPLFSPEELTEFQEVNDIFIRFQNGNVVLICTAMV